MVISKPIAQSTRNSWKKKSHIISSVSVWTCQGWCCAEKNRMRCILFVMTCVTSFSGVTTQLRFNINAHSHKNHLRWQRESGTKQRWHNCQHDDKRHIPMRVSTCDIQCDIRWETEHVANERRMEEADREREREKRTEQCKKSRMTHLGVCQRSTCGEIRWMRLNGDWLSLTANRVAWNLLSHRQNGWQMCLTDRFSRALCDMLRYSFKFLFEDKYGRKSEIEWWLHLLHF